MKHNKNKGSNVPNLRFPEFTGEWKKTTINNECKINPTTPPLPNLFVYVDLEAVVKGELIKREVIEKHIAPSRAQRVLRDGDILFQCVRPYQLNNYLYLKQDEQNWVASTGYAQLRTEHIGRFIYQYLYSPRLNKDVMLRCTGTSYPAISSSDLGKIDIYICRKEEQQKIASLLSLIDERISTQNKIIAHLESLIKGLCLDVYERCEKIPYKISEIGHKHTTINLSKEELSDNGRNCIIYGELFTTYGCVIDVVQSKTTKNCTPKSLSKGNDILFPSSTTVDATSLISPSALKEVGVVLGGDMFSINVNNSHNCEAISYIINNVLKNKLARYAQGSTIIHIYYDDIKDYTLMLPVKEKQNLLANIMHCISTKISTEKDILSFYLQQKGYLLQNMFI